MRPATLLVVFAVACATTRAVALVMSGEVHRLRPHAVRARPSSPEAPPVMLLALDGVSRDQLYEMLRAGELPNLSALLGGDHLAHAYFDDTFLSTLPSTTMAAWVSALTGTTPAEHGVSGNEYFVRETRTFECPAPVSFQDLEPTLAMFDDSYLDKLYAMPSVYERMRAKDRDILIWVAMSPIYRGADELLFTRRENLVPAIVDSFGATLQIPAAIRHRFETLDIGAIDAVTDQLAKGPLPDVLTLYLPGADLYAHIAEEGPDVARRTYLREVVDPPLAKLVRRLRARGQLDRLWVIVAADHGHTAVMHDATHALGAASHPPDVLRAAGFRVRPFAQNVAEADPFSAVLAYGGAMAYVYLANRSLCPGDHDRCPWEQPPRYREDVLAAADAFYRANLNGAMRGTLDMVLARVPKPVAEVDGPFEVYIGDGKTVPIDAYLAEHPHRAYIRFAERMDDLAVGPHGERAGDVVLIARNGNEARRENRFYFARPYQSWHGSPSRRDSEVPLIVANRHHDAATIGKWVRAQLGARPFSQRLTDLMIGLRDGALGQ
jgi:hypothetical protein